MFQKRSMEVLQFIKWKKCKMKNYKIENNKIIITDLSSFNVEQILNCGQIFRYVIDGDVAKVYSKNKMAVLLTKDDRVEIETSDVGYFVNFFDLNTDYEQIKTKLMQDKFLTNSIEFGYGIRILKNDCYEMIISFIISANNNIKRIKNSINYLCEKFGEKCDGFYAFPTLEQLRTATVQDFKDAGLGYRAEYLFETVNYLTEDMIGELKHKTKDEKFNFLVSLKGVGEKVANCILLFGLDEKNVFPVDTWINKVYNKINNTNFTNRKEITKQLTEKYGELAGFAQQYFFYYFRENKIND